MPRRADEALYASVHWFDKLSSFRIAISDFWTGKPNPTQKSRQPALNDKKSQCLKLDAGNTSIRRSSMCENVCVSAEARDSQINECGNIRRIPVIRLCATDGGKSDTVAPSPIIAYFLRSLSASWALTESYLVVEGLVPLPISQQRCRRVIERARADHLVLMIVAPRLSRSFGLDDCCASGMRAGVGEKGI